ncbi:MAG: hypothetical protein P4L84_21755 [Isosphaeraceae bacterium]|nr:hypothetical protein [Isosphaeraceae bacterium]
MSRPPTDPAKDRQQMWLNDAAVLKVGWVWWLVLLSNMALFAWGLQGVDRYSVIPLSCVWLGAFSCCMIFHIESTKRVLALRNEVEELRRALAERDGPRDVYSSR